MVRVMPQPGGGGGGGGGGGDARQMTRARHSNSPPSNRTVSALSIAGFPDTVVFDMSLQASKLASVIFSVSSILPPPAISCGTVMFGVTFTSDRPVNVLT